MIRALWSWLTPTRFYEPTGADLIGALRRVGYSWPVLRDPFALVRARAVARQSRAR